MMVLFILLSILVIGFLFFSRPRPLTKNQKEFFNRVNWQRETYGFEFYTFGSPETGMGMGKHMKNATKEQRDAFHRHRKEDTIEKSYQDWKKRRGIE